MREEFNKTFKYLHYRYYPAINTPKMLYESEIPWGGNHIAWIFFIREATEYYYKGLMASFQVHDMDTLTDLFLKGGHGFAMEVMEAGMLILLKLFFNKNY